MGRASQESPESPPENLRQGPATIEHHLGHPWHLLPAAFCVERWRILLVPASRLESIPLSLKLFVALFHFFWSFFCFFFGERSEIRDSSRVGVKKTADPLHRFHFTVEMIVDHVVSVLAVKRQKKRIECSTMATVRQRKFSKKKRNGSSETRLFRCQSFGFV